MLDILNTMYINFLIWLPQFAEHVSCPFLKNLMTEKKEWKQENDKILIINVTNKKNYSTENAR